MTKHRNLILVRWRWLKQLAYNIIIAQSGRGGSSCNFISLLRQLSKLWLIQTAIMIIFNWRLLSWTKTLPFFSNLRYLPKIIHTQITTIKTAELKLASWSCQDNYLTSKYIPHQSRSSWSSLPSPNIAMFCTTRCFVSWARRGHPSVLCKATGQCRRKMPPTSSKERSCPKQSADQCGLGMLELGISTLSHC